MFVAVLMLRDTNVSEWFVVYTFSVEFIRFNVSLICMISVKRNLTSTNSFVPEDTGSYSCGSLIPTYNTTEQHNPS